MILQFRRVTCFEPTNREHARNSAFARKSARFGGFASGSATVSAVVEELGARVERTFEPNRSSSPGWSARLVRRAYRRENRLRSRTECRGWRRRTSSGVASRWAWRCRGSGRACSSFQVPRCFRGSAFARSLRSRLHQGRPSEGFPARVGVSFAVEDDQIGALRFRVERESAFEEFYG